MIVPRPYQEAQRRAVLERFKSDRATLIAAATGTGKTVLICMIAGEYVRQGCRVMVVAHREELVRKTAGDMEQMLGCSVGIEMAGSRADNGIFDQPKVVVASVQTLASGNRMRQFRPSEFGLVVFDEAHRSIARSYLKVEDYFKDARVLGVTATPDRSDKRCLSGLYDSIAHRYPILDAIMDGWLVEPKCRRKLLEGVDLSAVKVTAGDFQKDELAAMMTGDGERLHAVALDLLPQLNGKSCVLFAANVDHAMHQARVLNEHKPGCAAAVYGAMDRDHRREVLKAHRTGQLQIITNYDVLSEGTDLPYLHAVAMCCPTKSTTRYAQQIGRVTRPLPGLVDSVATTEMRRAAIAASHKPNAFIYDYVGTSRKHNLATLLDVVFPDLDDRVRAVALEKMEATGEPLVAEEAVEDAKAEIVRIEHKRMTDAKMLEGAKAKGKEEWVSAFEVVGERLPDQEVWQLGVTLNDADRRLLKDNKYDPAAMPVQAAIRLASVLRDRRTRGLATPRQVARLEQWGFKQARHMTFQDANAVIRRRAANGWRPVGAKK